MPLPQLTEISHRINTLVSQRRDWVAIRSDLQDKLTQAQARYHQLQRDYARVSLLKATGDGMADDDHLRIGKELEEAQTEVMQLEAALQASEDTAIQTDLLRKKEEQRKREVAVERAHRDMTKAVKDLDNSIDTISKRFQVLLDAQHELLTQVGRKSYQVVENIQSPHRNFARCLASHLPMHSGFEKLDPNERDLQEMLPDLEQLLEHVKKH